jgi:hypothetical protein
MRRRRTNRRGAAVLELAIILPVFIVLTFGILDLGVGMFRYHVLANAARQAARRAIVHGEHANAIIKPWGPPTINVLASDDGTPIVDGHDVAGYPDGIQSLLVGCNLEETTIKLEWIDGSNALQKQVRATVTSPYTPLALLSLHTVTLQASSTMQIAH